MSCRSMAACCVLGGFSVLLCSCALVRKPAAVYGGPLFRSLPDDSADNDHPVPLTIIDDRPDWEKLYYPGSNVVERYDWAITFVPAENFRPRPFDSLRHQMASAAAKLPIRPARISIRLTSFQITFDERDKQRQRHLIAEAAKAKILEQERKEREEEERNEALHGKSDDDEDDNHESNFAKQLVGDIFGAVMQAAVDAAIKGIAEDIKNARDPLRRQERGLPPPPPELQKRRHVAGLSSRIEVMATLWWHDGRTLRIPLIAETTGSPTGRLFEAPDIPINVRHTISKLAGEMRSRARTFLAGNTRIDRW